MLLVKETLQKPLNWVWDYDQDQRLSRYTNDTEQVYKISYSVPHPCHDLTNQMHLEVTKYLNRHYPLQYTVSGNNGLADNKSHIRHFRMQVTDILDVPSQYVDLAPMLCRQWLQILWWFSFASWTVLELAWQINQIPMVLSSFLWTKHSAVAWTPLRLGVNIGKSRTNIEERMGWSFFSPRKAAIR